MGSVVITDAPPDLARYPHSMVVGDPHAPGPERQPHSSSASSLHGHGGHSNPTAPPRSSLSTTSTTRQTSQNRPASTADSAGAPEHARAQGGPQPTTAAAREGGSAMTARAHAGGDERDGFDRSGFPLSQAPRGLASQPSQQPPPPHQQQTQPPSPQLLPTIRSSLSFVKSRDASPSRTTKIHNLAQIHSFVSEEASAARQGRPGTGASNGNGASDLGARAAALRGDESQQFEISEMPVTEIIEMVAGLLTKITTTNDQQRQQSEGGNGGGPVPQQRHGSISAEASSTSSSATGRQTASVLAFHGKNVPSISILSYLARIHKYCPTTYEVFLALLVYFDRMMEAVNRGTLASFRSAARSAERDVLAPGSSTALAGDALRAAAAAQARQQHPERSATGMATPPPSGSAAPQVDPADSSPSTAAAITDDNDPNDEFGRLAHCFVVDSFNIHRLVIAGVTCASKFFSDVFYTNSRYAKVGGLPIHELNHLELQFLLLNDFRLSVPVEELEAYGSRLVKFYLEEVAQQMTSSDALYMQPPSQAQSQPQLQPQQSPPQ